MNPSYAAARAAQPAWAATPVRERVRVVRRLRQEIASGAEALAATVPGTRRTLADTLASEVLPLLEACRFLEREAAFLLAPRRESATSRPRWLGGVSAETRRDPLGLVLILAPGNYPLFLPGVQALQALAAGNAVLWKPAPAGVNAALALERMLVACGLDPALVTVLPSEVSAATEVMHAGVDKVVLTGSASTGRAVLHQLADTLTPSVMELSGCDAVFILEGADLARAVDAISFGLRLNGSATCMAPRRLFVTDVVADTLIPALIASLRPESSGVDCDLEQSAQTTTRLLLQDLVDEATLYGATVLVDGLSTPAEEQHTTLLDRVTPDMRIAQTDIFAPVLSMLRVEDVEAALVAYHACPYALTASIFGPARPAKSLAGRLNAGTVIINDIIVPTADPRASFSGRKQSGFGATRGREGLLEMTAPKTILHQRSRSPRPYRPTGPAHIPFFAGLAQLLHARGWRARLAGARTLVKAAQRVK